MAKLNDIKIENKVTFHKIASFIFCVVFVSGILNILNIRFCVQIFLVKLLISRFMICSRSLRYLVFD